MLKSSVSWNTWTLSAGERRLLSHTPTRPFATAVRQEKRYSANRGSVKTEVAETARVPLTDLREEADGVLCFFSGERCLRVRPEEEKNGFTLHFTGEKGWSYEFRLPARKGEAVFGGGEQYRKVNLRGERVVNFVSEHIKATTIVEKALVPRPLYLEKPHSSIGSYAPMPVFVTDRGRLILFDTPCDGLADFSDDNELLFAFDACPKSLTLQFGKSFRELSALLAARIPNRQYLPAWCHEGMILGIQGGTQTILDKCFMMLDAGRRSPPSGARTGRARSAPSWASRSTGTVRSTGRSIPISGARSKSSTRAACVFWPTSTPTSSRAARCISTARPRAG